MLGVLIRGNFASLRVGTVQKRATNYQIYTKRVKFEGGTILQRLRTYFLLQIVPTRVIFQVAYSNREVP